MEHYLDIETELFEKIREHETTRIQIPREINGREVRTGDTLKLYHPGDGTEALRVEVSGVEERGTKGEDGKEEEKSGETGQEVTVSFFLLEWMCRLETELDELLRQEEEWMQGLL